jgi:hypothetical protein
VRFKKASSAKYAIFCRIVRYDALVRLGTWSKELADQSENPQQQLHRFRPVIVQGNLRVEDELFAV